MKISVLAISLALSFPALATEINVPGTSDPWLAGMPAGTTASYYDVAPNQSPVFAGNVYAGSNLTFNVIVTAPVGNCVGCTAATADGGAAASHATSAENGISDVISPINALVGVFLGNDAPNGTAAPSSLNFTASGLGTSFTTLSPELKQVFFIGDGLTGTGSGTLQTFVVPTGAARLYLGTMDGYEWGNNVGVYSVNIGGMVPEPESYAMLLAGLGMLFGLKRRASAVS